MKRITVAILLALAACGGSSVAGDSAPTGPTIILEGDVQRVEAQLIDLTVRPGEACHEQGARGLRRGDVSIQAMLTCDSGYWR